LDGVIQMVEGHYFKIVSTIYSSNWNWISSGFMRLIWGVTARVASPAVQGIVVTRDMASAFWIISIHLQIFCACSGSCARLKCIVFRLESTIDGEIWYLKPFQTEFLKFQSIL
jgi:hypothetical protein